MKDWWEKVKKPIMILGIVGIILALFFVPSFSRASYEVALGQATQFENPSLLLVWPEVMPDVFNNLKIALTLNFENYLNWLKIFGVIYLIFSMYVMYKLSNKKEYESIEHGSADWCKPTEAYKILNI